MRFSLRSCWGHFSVRRPPWRRTVKAPPGCKSGGLADARPATAFLARVEVVGSSPKGIALDGLFLDRDSLKEPIACGRPGSKMLFFLKGAYTATRCWGLGAILNGANFNRSTLSSADLRGAFIVNAMLYQTDAQRAISAMLI